MTGRSPFLGGITPSPPPPPPQDSSSTVSSLDSDFVVILAALLCALICVLGLVAVARCAWIRRIPAASSSSYPPAANKGLKKKVLKSLPKVTYGHHEDYAHRDQAKRLSDCAICLADFAPGEEIRLLPQCGHGFHVACIDTWLATHSSCPSCRQVLARCHKCGRLPPAARIQAEPRESHISSFLP